MVVEGRYEVIPLQAGVSLGRCHLGVTPGEVEHKSVPPASIGGAPVEVGQEGTVRDHLPFHLQPVAAVQPPAHRGSEVGGEREKQGALECRPAGTGRHRM